MAFEYLKEVEGRDFESFLPAAEQHLEHLKELQSKFEGVAGEAFIGNYVNAFELTGSPAVVNLDRNVSEFAKNRKSMIEEAPRITDEMREIVRSTAGNVAGYKMNEQSMLTFLLGGEPTFVQDAKDIYKEIVGVDPVLWTDEKIRDIPSTNYQTSRIILGLGFDAIHNMPQIGPDGSGATQLAAPLPSGPI